MNNQTNNQRVAGKGVSQEKEFFLAGTESNFTALEENHFFSTAIHDKIRLPYLPSSTKKESE
ncbi:MAG: hypothetical protein CSB48_14255 [Proteobacteria bacterium]|nr:MAG: hypothetical protein CSB48_14255 [Pseudomonadota bacterium]